MGLFDVGSSITETFSNAANSLGSAAAGVASSLSSTVSGVAGAASKLAGALNNLSNPSAVISSLRSMNVPMGSGPAYAATSVQFGGPGTKDDWRVRLSLPPNFFAESPVLAPLKAAGGLVFPYTPTIQITHSATYDDVPITHQNYQFLAYQNSRVDAFQISGPFHVEDPMQAQYWIAAVHFLRSATKMYTGDTQFHGSPPPIVTLNGYGDYVFKNVPVVIKAFSVELPSDVNYIATSVGASGFSGFGAASNGAPQTMAGLAASSTQLAGIAGAMGSAKAAQILGTAGAAAGIIGGVSNMLSGGSTAGAGGSFTAAGNATHVPNKSTISVTVQPIYSREAVRNFSLQKFVNGGYVNGSGGYI